MDKIQHVFDRFNANIESLLADHGEVIRDVADKVDNGPFQDLGDILDDFAADAKSELGAEAANSVSDAEAEEAIEIAEKWVTDNVSNGTAERRIAAGCVVHGYHEAMRILLGPDNE